jgi:DNA-binding beta-propeller fold protein YncE
MTRSSLSLVAERFAEAIVALVLAGVVSACSVAAPAGGTMSPTLSATPLATASEVSSPSVKPTPSSAIIESFDAGGAGWAMTKAGGALWIQVDPPVDAIVRIDAETGAATPAVPGGHVAKSGPEGLWVVGADWLSRVDPATGKQSLRVPMGGEFALGDGAVWLSNKLGLHRIDPETGVVDKPIAPSVESPCQDAKDLVVAFDSAWLACKEGHVVRIDIATGDSTTIPTALGANKLAVTEEGVWVTNYQAGSVSRIDSKTNEVTTIPGTGSGVGITSGDGYIWAAMPHGISKIDPGTASIVDTISFGLGEYYGLVWDDGVIWASTRGNRVLKIDVSGSAP